jgi:hypothetical protein
MGKCDLLPSPYSPNNHKIGHLWLFDEFGSYFGLEQKGENRDVVLVGS